MSDNFGLIIVAVECDCHGKSMHCDVEYTSKSGENFNHQMEWVKLDKKITQGRKYNYLPRGRVEVKNNKVSIFLNPNINTERIIQTIIRDFDLSGIEDIKVQSDGSKHYKYYC
jgi:hypothetical protein